MSRDSPTCGIIQVDGSDYEDVRKLLLEIADGEYSNIGMSKDFLKKYCPLLVDLIFSMDIQRTLISDLLKDILSSVVALFNNSTEPAREMYGPIAVNNMKLGCFPNYDVCRGLAKYAADKPREVLVTGCRKDSQKHPTLTSGLFTMFCPHGVCLGFRIMENPESPRTAFEILMSRFKEMPSLVIYDNACKLHLYALKREPERFKNTRFMVDRLHYTKGHVGCSLGYCMDTYSSDPEVSCINSQANEHANGCLRNISTQLAYGINVMMIIY